MSKFNFIKAIRYIPMHPTTKNVAMILSTYADYETGICYPTIQTLMDDTGLSNRVVCLHIQNLEKLGFLAVKRANGRNSTYKFIVENLTKAVTESHQLRRVTSDFNDNEAVTFMQEAVTLSTESSDAASHKQPLTIINYQENSKYIHENENQAGENSSQSEKPKSAKKPKSRKTQIPENFAISDQVRNWAAEKGFNRLDEHLDSFVDKCAAKGYQYVDWDRAFMTAIREDWAKLRTQQYQSQQRTQQSSYWDKFKQPQEPQNWYDPIDVTPKKTVSFEGVGHA